jgi:hypothetical protein
VELERTLDFGPTIYIDFTSTTLVWIQPHFELHTVIITYHPSCTCSHTTNDVDTTSNNIAARAFNDGDDFGPFAH